MANIGFQINFMICFKIFFICEGLRAVRTGAVPPALPSIQVCPISCMESVQCFEGMELLKLTDYSQSPSKDQSLYIIQFKKILFTKSGFNTKLTYN